VPNADEMLAVAAARADELAAPGLSPAPRRKVAVLACMDTRIHLFTMLGLELGDAHIIRNAGGLVTDDAIRSLGISQRLLGTEEIVVVMHEDCGLHGAAPELGGFDDLDAALAGGLARLRSNAALPARDQIRGFVFDPETGELREVAAPES
jgi:carbonic anhydrase